MSEQQQQQKKKSNRRYGENRVFVIGHVVEPAKAVSGGKYISVPLMIPSWVRDGKRQWLRVVVDVFGSDMDRVLKAKPGDMLRATAHLIPRKVKDDNGETKTVMRLRANMDDGIGILSGLNVADPKNPPDLGICRNEVFFLGTYVADKDARGPEDGPKLRGEGDKKMAFVRLVYNDMKKSDGEGADGEEDEGIWTEVALFDKNAEIANKYLRHMSVVYVTGSLTVREARFTVGGKTPNDLKISPRPYGFQFFRQGSAADGGGGQKRGAPAAPKDAGPSVRDYGDDDGDDLPF